MKSVVLPGSWEKFPSWRRFHAGSTGVVVGSGPSCVGFDPPDGIRTIGVNDVVRVVNTPGRGEMWLPDYLYMVDPPKNFTEKPDKLDAIRFTIKNRPLFSQVFEWLDDYKAEYYVHVKLGRGASNAEDWDKGTSIPTSNSSTWPATCLAAFLGLNPIGLLGQDFSDGHSLGKPRELETIVKAYTRLYYELKGHGIQLYNLSDRSRLPGVIPRGKIAGESIVPLAQ